ncbi:MAG: hypothetical protein IKI33_03360, partial [Eubacterium sp.]|nr:hypothetical protein [Eubacterium sp.]
GDHYYLTVEQFGYLLSKYESGGIPTYAVYNTQGEQTPKTVFRTSGTGYMTIFLASALKTISTQPATTT